MTKPHPFYHSKAWKYIRKAKLARDPICQFCHIKPAVEVDHIKAINAGGNATAWENLKSCCHACHSRKTLYLDRLHKDRVPIKGCNENGLPLDPEHWWRK